MLEKTIEKHLTTTLRKQGCHAIKLNDPRQSGLPDRLILTPNGKTYFVELKAPGKKPRPLQQLWLDKLTHAGFTCYVVDTKKKADEVIHEILTT